MVSQASKNIEETILQKRLEYMTQMYGQHNPKLVKDVKDILSDIECNPGDYDLSKCAIMLIERARELDYE